MKYRLFMSQDGRSSSLKAFERFDARTRRLLMNIARDGAQRIVRDAATELRKLAMRSQGVERGQILALIPKMRPIVRPLRLEAYIEIKDPFAETLQEGGKGRRADGFLTRASDRNRAWFAERVSRAVKRELSNTTLS